MVVRGASPARPPLMARWFGRPYAGRSEWAAASQNLGFPPGPRSSSPGSKLIVAAASVGLLYHLRHLRWLAIGPRIPDSLPLLQLAGFDGQPLARVLDGRIGGQTATDSEWANTPSGAF
jgi:hypothetical protein